MLPRLSLRSHCPLGRICDLVFVCELLIPTTLGTYLGSLASGCLSLSLSPSLVTSRPVAHTPRVPECRDDFCYTAVQPSQPPIERGPSDWGSDFRLLILIPACWNTAFSPPHPVNLPRQTVWNAANKNQIQPRQMHERQPQQRKSPL